MSSDTHVNPIFIAHLAEIDRNVILMCCVTAVKMLDTPGGVLTPAHYISRLVHYNSKHFTIQADVSQFSSTHECKLYSYYH
jgi:hypothetical protein